MTNKPPTNMETLKQQGPLRDIREEFTQNPEAARAFLRELGVKDVEAALSPERRSYVIANEEGLKAAINRVNELIGAAPGTPEGYELANLATAVVRYEDLKER